MWKNVYGMHSLNFSNFWFQSLMLIKNFCLLPTSENICRAPLALVWYTSSDGSQYSKCIWSLLYCGWLCGEHSWNYEGKGLPAREKNCKWLSTETSTMDGLFRNTGWSIWYCPILNIDCGIFSQISKQVFWVILITNFDTFCYLKSDFWYSKKIFCPKIMIIRRLPPMKK